MKSKVRILVDMDMTLCNFERRRYEIIQDERPEIAIHSRNIKEFYGYQSYLDTHGQDIAEYVQEITTRKNFFLSLPPMDEAISGFKTLSAFFDVRICSAPLRHNPYCVMEKLEWLREHLGEKVAAEAFITRDKHTVDADYLIDDRPNISHPDATWKHILFHSNYAHQSQNHWNILKSWNIKDLDNLMNEIEKC